MDPDQALKVQLRSWNLEADVPPSFRMDVWRAIAVREGSSSTVRWLDFLAGRLGQPRFAVPFGLLILTVSLGLDRVQADSADGRTRRTVDIRYVASVEPMAMAETNR